MSDKFYVCVKGEILFEVDGVSSLVKPGDLVVIPKNTWFSYRNNGQEAASLILVHVPPFNLEYEEFL